MGIAYDTLSTKRGVDINPVKFSAGVDFSGAANTNAGATVIKAFAKNYKLGETKSFSVRISDVNDADSSGDAGAGDTVQYQWKLAEHAAYSAPVDLISSGAGDLECTINNPCELKDNGADTADTGIFIYSTATADAVLTSLAEGNTYSFTYDHQEGRAYEYGNSNNAHQEVECSGRGSCDASTGRCTCYSGFSGEACQRTVCPSDCSGHGVCQDLRRFAADAGQTYDAAYDANKQMGCLCDNGYRGPDCSMVECPSGDDPMGYFGGDGKDAAGNDGEAMDCSGRGLCDYSSGQCSCFKGYFGERCEYQTNFV